MPIGINAPTIAFLLNAITHGGLERIGTIAALANNPALKEFAGRYGVDLFVDDESTGATGPHLHLQVPREAGRHG